MKGSAGLLPECGIGNRIYRVRNLEYESTAMNNFMRSVKHCTQVQIVGTHSVDWSCMSANSDVMQKFSFPVKFWRCTCELRNSGEVQNGVQK